MAIFGSRKKKNGTRQDIEQAPKKQDVRVCNTQDRSRLRKNKTPTPVEANIDMLSELVEDLHTSVDTSGETPAKALRMLFSLSESAETENRTKMVRDADLVPELLDFLKRCERGSSEQYLALLVLNNISIPSENKRLIALECGGAQILSRLLCLDPSCHLMAIILVNLTFCDAELRKELVTRPNIELIESLSFALRVASFTQEEFDIRQPLSVPNDYGQYTPRYLLASVLKEERALNYNNTTRYNHNHEILIDLSQILFPETARWCLSALKNLSRPVKDSTAAHLLVKSGIVHLIMRFISIGDPINPINSLLSDENSQFEGIEMSHEVLLRPESEPFLNDPTGWKSNSIQDAALFIVMNLAAMKSSRDTILELSGVNAMTKITEHNKRIRRDKTDYSSDEQKQLEFQPLKARMTLAYLIGSEGHFGQPRRRASSNGYNEYDDSAIIVTESEVSALLGLLADSLQQRAKAGAGGYSAATFNVKWVLYSIRCLVTNTFNQIQIVNVVGVRLNVLLLKVLALHALRNSTVIDAEAAEYAAFTLYLLSNRGFKEPFLPGSFGVEDRIAGTGSLSSKVLTSYIHMESVTPAGRHAADQLLLRLRYLCFLGSIPELTPDDKEGPSNADYAFDESLLDAAEAIIVEKRKHGARPCDDIFDRPILRSKVPKRGTHVAPWENGAAVSVYPNALIAVQQLSFGSTKVRHVDAIDDIQIANNIANSANGEKTESYNYWWTWQDSASSHIRNSLSRLRSPDSSSVFGVFPSINQDSFVGGDFPFSFFGCGNLCGADTSVGHDGNEDIRL
mmetsp:Transcript_28175/g.51005  ORF Transcript_28175/g.51005 Transcript_28175/m.51005 type:complete len:797 (-) Transcript_28175:47-2437(-)|eukprot:CAMPEP_0202497848 /NCGR_PEP_ID=MMETSP1361-20130828/24065_1 /ASSEMBLY_ACC=CAM_ASM_000849 /TAXON_ID=210615 /ORGANISM="Staurosira complex sp., Strain CCMP2646" /LENGTH=796 /DNA_ID=CAMNT_0049129559 /DNA_START=142 /DNA_END=2532 /DNA_ORIENTATION=+